MSLKHYAMTTNDPMNWVDEYLEKMGVIEFDKYHKRVNEALDKLRPGHYYEISTQVKPEEQELFIKFCCCYVRDHWRDYEMSDDFCRIRNKKRRI